METQPKYEDEGGEESHRKTLDAARALTNRLSRDADEQVRAKALLEMRWIDDLRQYYGRYEVGIAEGLENEGRSTAFVKLTRHKTNSWAARLSDLLFPTDDKNWGIKPTPLPTLAEQAKLAIKKAEAAVEATNEAQDPAQQERMKEIADAFAQTARQTRSEIEEAEKRCGRMETAIEDQLVESDYVTQCRDVIEDACRLGTGILKGPMTSQRLRAQWREQDGVWNLAQIPDPMPEFRRVDPWHFFPDMSASKIGEAEFTYERHLPTRRDLKRLAKKLGFNPEGVKRLLEEGPRPLGIEVDHLAQLRLITGEGDPIADRYVMWEYHGALETDEICLLLRAAGKEEKARRFEEERNPLDDHRVIIHFCNDEVLKISPEFPLDSGEGLYSVFTFEKGETSVFGLGVPNIMSDSQRALNAAWRMVMDNAGLSVGPQILVNKGLLTPQDGTWGLRPFKVWLLSSTTNISPNMAPFQTFPIEINTDALIKIIELAKIFIDEETGMPQIAQGEQGAASTTLGGMSMLFNSANVVFRRTVKAWDDDLTKPTLRRAYDWNMQFNPDESVKGDMQVDARGTSVLLVREIQSQTLMNIMTNWTTHPVIGPWLACKKTGIRPGLEKTLQTMMITPDDLLGTKDEFDEYMRQQAEQAGDGEEGTDPNAIRLQIAQLEAQVREKIANMQMEVEVAKLSAQTGKSEQEIKAKYGIEEMKVASKERTDAVKIAVEDRRAKKAQQEGKSQVEAVGQGVG